MLILARKAGEGIQIGATVRVDVLEIKGKQVRLGIEAPAQTPVHRTEVYERIVEQNRRAAVAPADLKEAHHVWLYRRRARGVEAGE